MPGNNKQPQKPVLDQNIVNLAKAIRDVESNGNYQARGAIDEYGAYQFRPSTWAKVAPASGINVALEQASPEQQNKVAYDYIKSLADQGYNPGQIASIWNSGRADPSGIVSRPGAAVQFNVPQYVENVYNKYSYYKGSGATPDIDGREGKPITEMPQYHALFPREEDDSVLVKGAKAVGNVPGSAVGLAKDLASLVFHPIQTIQNIGGIAIGGLESLDDEATSENTEKFDMFVDALKQRYGSLEALENTAVNDPFAFGADLLGLLYGGAGIAGKAGTVTRGVDAVGGAAMAPARAIGNTMRAPLAGSIDVATTDAAARLGIEAAELPASARSTSPLVPLLESAASKTMGGAGVVERVSAAADRLTTLADDLVKSAEGAEDLVTAGENLSRGITDFAKKYKQTVDDLYTKFDEKRGDTVGQTSNSVRILNDILDKKEAIGDIEGARFFKSKLNALTGGKRAGSKKKFPAPTYRTLKEMRTDVGQRVKGFGDMFVTANKAQLKAFYAALSADLRATIKSTRNSKNLLKELDEANVAYRVGREKLESAIVKKVINLTKEKKFDKILPALLRPGVSVNEVKLIMAMTGEGGAAQIRTSLLSQILNKAKNTDGNFTPGGIERQLAKEGEKWKQILTPEQYQALSDLSQVSKAMGRAQKVAEGSQTAYLAYQLAQLGVAGASILDLLQGNLVGFAQKWALLGMSAAGAKIVASPFGQRLLTTGLTRRAEITAAVEQARAQGLTIAGEDGNMSVYGNSPDNSALPRPRDGADAARSPREQAPREEGGGGTGTEASQRVAAAVSPIIERAKARSGLDFTVEDIQITGSRSAGVGEKASDMDVIVQISGAASEADVLAALRRGRTKVDGAKVDYTITKEPIASFRKRAEDPEKYTAPLTSEFVPDTAFGRMKESVRRYFENISPGLSTRDVSEGGQRFDIGLTSVKGRLAGAADDLVKEADELYASGDYAGAQKKYNEALAAGIDTLASAFEGTGIKVKPKGVGFGVYGGLEPNYDAVAIVPKAKEDLFHYVLADVADRDFKQYSMLTYRQASPDAPYGVVDEARGISIEPQLRYNLENPIQAKDIPEIQKLATDAGLAGLSIREGGKAIDIINITKYNDNYENFIESLAKFESSLAGKGISGAPEYRKAEVRFIGNDPEGGHGFASYKSVRDQFRAQNPDFFNSDEGFTSRLIERIKNRQSVSPTEIEQLTKMQDITPLERGVVLSALDDLQGVKKIPTKDLVARIEGKALPVTMYETDAYATYGIHNVEIRQPTGKEAKTLVFETPVEHGASGHFNNPKHFGHTRVAITEEGGKKIGYITEMQSDVAQKADIGYELAKRDPELQKSLDEALANYNKRRDDLGKLVEERGKDATSEEISAINQLHDAERKAAIEAAAKRGRPIQEQQLLALLKDRNKYQDIMLRGTLQYFEKQGVEEVRVATPSTAARIEGFIDDEGGAPYELPGGGRFGADANDLEVGDEIGYMGEQWKVIRAEGDEISAVPEDAITYSFRPQDFIEGERANLWEEALHEIEKHVDKKGIVPPEVFARDNKMSAYGSGNLPWMAEKAFDGIDEPKTIDELKDLFDETFDQEFDWRENLESIYGGGSIFEKTRRVMSKVYTTELVYIVEDTNKIENFNQPSGYSGVDESAMLAIDEDPSQISNYFSDTQKTVLENYVDLRNGALKKLEKTEGVKIKGGTSDDYYSRPSWYEFPMTKVKRYLFGA